MRWQLAVMFAALGASAQAAPLVFYADAPLAGLNDASWTTHNLTATTPVHSGTRSISMEPDNYGGVYLVDRNTPHRFADFQSLTFWVNGGSGNGQQLRIYLTLRQQDRNNPYSNAISVATATVNSSIAGGGVASNTWRQVTVNFDATTTLTHGAFDGLIIMDDSGANQSAVFIDDIQFNERTQALASAPLSATVNFAGTRKPISPLIYGVNFGDDAQAASLRFPLRRNGGNSTTRYNWSANSHSTASDYYYQDIPDSYDGQGRSTVDHFVFIGQSAGSASIITMPTIGWQPLGDRQKHGGFSIAKYGPQDQNECTYGDISYCRADDGNGYCDSVGTTTTYCKFDSYLGHWIIKGNNPADTSIPMTTTDVTAWVNHLVSTFGSGSGAGVRYYALDNESMLWNSTHRDVHPAAPTYDEIWTKGRDVAAAIKAADPGAQVMGPVTWGWCDLFTSAADPVANGPGGSCTTGPDRNAHGGTEFVRWYLQQAKSYAQSHGNNRLIDYLDVHFYPQGGVDGLGDSGSSELPDDAAKRLRSLKELYDPNWLSESWIGQFDPNGKPNLIPRLKAWIAADYPGTKLALTEYKWGPDEGETGALAQAEALAIFGREGLDAATRWVSPDVGSLAERAYRLFLNYDNSHTIVAGDSIPTTPSNVDELGAYAIDNAGSRSYVVLINRATAPRDITVNFSSALSGNYKAFRFDATQDVTQVASATVNGTAVTLSAVPGRSATLLVLPSPTALDSLFSDGFE